MQSNNKTIAEKYNWSNEYKAVSVDKMRKLAAEHGHEMSIIISYDKKSDSFDCVTVGRSRVPANIAAELGKILMEKVGCKIINENENKLNEHNE